MKYYYSAIFRFKIFLLEFRKDQQSRANSIDFIFTSLYIICINVYSKVKNLDSNNVFFIHHLYIKVHCFTIRLIISLLEVYLNVLNNNSNNQNCTNDAPFLKVIIKVIYHMLMMIMLKLLKQNMLIITNNIKLSEKLMFHIQVGIISCQK